MQFAPSREAQIQLMMKRGKTRAQAIAQINADHAALKAAMNGPEGDLFFKALKAAIPNLKIIR